MFTQKRKHLAFSVVVALCSLSHIAFANIQEESSTAELVFTSNQGADVSAMLLDTNVSGSVSGLVSTITIVQKYRNDSNDWVNGQYRFPLPENAAVDSLTLETEGRILHGVVKEKQAAQKEFNVAKKAGKKAGLLKQHRPNLFSMSLANIAPWSEVTATISFVSTVQYEHGTFSLRLPTTFTPRFIPGAPLWLSKVEETEFESEGSLDIDATAGWAFNTDQVPDASEITPPQIASPPNADSHRFSLTLLLDAGVPLDDISSVTHAINVAKTTNDTHEVSLANGTANLDRDLLLTWTPAANQAPEAAVFRQQGESAQHNLVMLIPPTKNVVSTLPREIIFIIDSSGSMAGVSILQAQQGLQTALNLLAPGDKFNVIDFDSSARKLFSAPQPATNNNVVRASTFVNNLVADGGTNMAEALEMAFSMPKEEQSLRQIVFITDGSVGNEQALFKMIRSKLGAARLFTVGIGSAPNAHFMRGAARFGRGSYQYIDDIALAASNMRGLFERLNRPILKDLKVWVDGESMKNGYPNPLPDLYLGQPVMLTVKTPAPVSEVVLSGNLAGESWQRTITVNGTANAQNIDKIWARSKVEQLESDIVTGLIDFDSAKKVITQTGLDYQLVTKHTSFIAVEEVVSKPAEVKAKSSQTPNLMPAGNTMPIPMPNTATPSSLLTILGAIMMLGSLATARYRRRRQWQ